MSIPIDIELEVEITDQEGEIDYRGAMFKVELCKESYGYSWTITDSYWDDTKTPLTPEEVRGCMDRVEDAVFDSLYD